MNSLYTLPRPIEARSVREGDQVACFAATDELIPTLGGLANAAAGAGVAWYTVAGVCHLDGWSAIETGGPVWAHLNSDATLVIREQLMLPGGPAPVTALLPEQPHGGNVLVRVALDWRHARHYQADAAPCRVCATTTQHRDQHGEPACKRCVESEIEGQLVAFAQALMGADADARMVRQ